MVVKFVRDWRSGMGAPEVEQLAELEVEQPVVEAERPLDVRLHVEWEEGDKEALDYIMRTIDEGIRRQFAQAFEIEEKLLRKTRTRLPNGQWLRNPDGSYVEDWSTLSITDMEAFIQEASAWAFFSTQAAIDSYAEAVFAKYTYDDAYDAAYTRQTSGTIGDKQARAKRVTRDERWRALYKTLYHRKAREVVERLDAHVRRVERIYYERSRQMEREFRAARG